MFSLGIIKCVAFRETDPPNLLVVSATEYDLVVAQPESPVKRGSSYCS